jgi:hypothetical protein
VKRREWWCNGGSYSLVILSFFTKAVYHKMWVLWISVNRESSRPMTHTSHARLHGSVVGWMTHLHPEL